MHVPHVGPDVFTHGDKGYAPFLAEMEAYLNPPHL